MTPEERQMLTDLANKISQSPAPARDPEADELIRTKIGSRPDALYILAQTVLIQNLALDHANQQIRDLQQRPPQPAPSFLGPTPAPPYIPGSNPPGYTAPPQPAPAPSFLGGGGVSSFLRSAATTAAGVAAGALAFEGIRSLFGGVEHLAGFGGGAPHFSSFMGQAPGADTIINNYYDPPADTPADDPSSILPDNVVDGTADDNTGDDSADDYDDSSSSGGDDLV